MDDAERVLRFWLDEIGPKGWYKRSDETDARIRAEFYDLWHAARARRLDGWLCTPRGALALLILLDQFPRNMFRGTEAAFSTDALARARACIAIRLGHDLATPEPERQFFYLPFMHSEVLADQERCVRLMTTRMPAHGAENAEHAVKHRDVIRRFARFPSRNAALGRTDSAAELAYRADRGYMS